MTTQRGDGWSTIWSGRTVDDRNPDLLLALIRANGFDGGAGSYSLEDWLAMASTAATRAQLTAASRVLEIGCGCGAFLHALHRACGCRIAGIDYSASLIRAARRHVEAGDFQHAEAVDIPFPDASFDAIFSHSVFHYFPDESYARRVCAAAHAKLRSGGILSVMDINDKAFETAYHDERGRLSGDPAGYARKYAELPHLFFDRDAFRDMLLEVGFRTVVFFDHDAVAYANRRFRFNVLATK